MSLGKLETRGSETLNERRDHLKMEAAADLVSLLIKGGHVFLEAQHLEAVSSHGWEETHQRIALIGAESEAELRKLQESLLGAKEKTQRLAMVLDFSAKQPNLPPALAEGIAKAVDNLTREL